MVLSAEYKPTPNDKPVEVHINVTMVAVTMVVHRHPSWLLNGFCSGTMTADGIVG